MDCKSVPAGIKHKIDESDSTSEPDFKQIKLDLADYSDDGNGNGNISSKEIVDSVANIPSIREVSQHLVKNEPCDFDLNSPLMASITEAANEILSNEVTSKDDFTAELNNGGVSSNIHNETHCELCDHHFSRARDLKRHFSAVHARIKSHRCEACNRTFADTGNYRKHVSEVHEKVKPHACPLCDRSFSRARDLKRHHSSVHEKIRPFFCDLCDYTSSEAQVLGRHMASIHKKETKEPLVVMLGSLDAASRQFENSFLTTLDDNK